MQFPISCPDSIVRAYERLSLAYHRYQHMWWPSLRSKEREKRRKVLAEEYRRVSLAIQRPGLRPSIRQAVADMLDVALDALAGRSERKPSKDEASVIPISREATSV